MNIKETAKSLGISVQTLSRYRKTLGIFEETKKGLTESQYKEVEKLRDKNLFTNEEKKKIILSGAESFNAMGLLEIEDTDSKEIINLKNDYNYNRKYIEYLQTLIKIDMFDKKVPDKNVSNMLEKFQSLNLKIVSNLEKSKSTGVDFDALIQERLNSYG